METWDRASYVAGGRPGLVLFVVFGPFGADVQIEPRASRHRTRGIPEGVSAGRFAAADPWTRGWLEPPWAKWLDEHEKKHTLPGGDQIPLGQAVRESAACVRVRGELADGPELLLALRDAIGIVSALVDAGGVAVLDPQTLRWWIGRDWIRAFVHEERFYWADHVSLILSEDWLHTRGMRKFGRPDISIRGVAADRLEDASELAGRFVRLQIDGGVLDPARPVVMRGLPEMRIEPHLADADLDDPDFNNVWLEVRGFA